MEWGIRPGTLRYGSNPKSITEGYVLTGTNSRTIADALSRGYSPAIYSGLYRNNIQLQLVGKDIWNVDVTWGPYEKKEKEPGDFKWSFSTGGGSKHITQAISHSNAYALPTYVAVDHKGTIGLNENGDVEGVDIPESAFEWQEERSLLLADYSFTYATILGELTYCVNNATFRGFAGGSVLFKGADGSMSAKDPLILEVTYRFAYSPNTSTLTVGDITGIDKMGWEYLWVEYKTNAPDVGGVKLPKRPSQVNIEQVYKVADFSLLGIGTD